MIRHFLKIFFISTYISYLISTYISYSDRSIIHSLDIFQTSTTAPAALYSSRRAGGRRVQRVPRNPASRFKRPCACGQERKKPGCALIVFFNMILRSVPFRKLLFENIISWKDYLATAGTHPCHKQMSKEL